ncbi:tRNA pseudouridine(38-40) synthase TruA [Peptoniphilus sp. SGI.035]|uniref:tRNA pseudouridine(38-40) synthase TruA n=1 Tax=unclassified Peptoniphilus TaxID=2637196 RepID=UPI0025F93508|nr:tRNA pseudouridine(38-40) synthase TruA [Peptoniphilus sp.]MCI5644022.1 tRNA pseudouridine(38-40) synthase TruA [Peptoniphilus sp.]MDD7352801.1 tRNA pseudouridine(38-40) synthase TruA [Peptoniphilaceae bacterium]MDY3902067.1 tRNA pseudouridine(38-40) synthase TruA [Peptoniphilus sp.]
MNILIKITYDGTKFHGFQLQPDERTVEGELNKGLAKTLNKEVKIFYAGRTDRGVHALGQYANFYSDTTIDIGNLPKVINFNLPEDVSVVGAKYVSDDFHARYDAKLKKYRYVVHRSRYRNALLLNKAYEYPYEVDPERMRKALSYLLGEHDFNSFMGKGAVVKDSIRTIEKIDVIEDGNFLYLDFIAKSFLKNMIRIVTGTALEIGRGQKEIEYMKEALIMKKRKAAGPTAPACGLYLVDVKY